MAFLELDIRTLMRALVLGNLVAGLTIIFTRPFRVGDDERVRVEIRHLFVPEVENAAESEFRPHRPPVRAGPFVKDDQVSITLGGVPAEVPTRRTEQRPAFVAHGHGNDGPRASWVKGDRRRRGEIGRAHV